MRDADPEAVDAFLAWCRAAPKAAEELVSRSEGIGSDAAPVLVAPSTACRASAGIREPSVRQAPDGGQERGPHPTESSRSTRRVFLAPPLLRHGGQKPVPTEKSGAPPVTSAVIATLGIRRDRQRERGTSGRCKPSAPGLG